MPEVRLVNVTKTFDGGRIVAVDHVNLHVKDGEYLTLLGPSGCGKTTTLRIIAGLVEPDEGQVYIGGRLVTDVPPEDRDIGFVFQTFALFPHMTVWENVTYGPRVKNWPESEMRRVAKEALEMVGLYERADAYPRELSGGMMQRVGLARALAAGAKLLLLDEPLSALDAKIRFELRYELRRLVKDLGLTAIHVTHDQAEAMSISDRIAVMRKGRILQVGTPRELYMRPKSIFVAHFVGEANFLEGYVDALQGGEATVRLRGDLLVQVRGADARLGERIVLSIRPEALTIRRGRSNDVNSLPGRVERVMFEGVNMRYEIRLDNEDLLVVVRPTLLGDSYEVGERVSVSFSPDKVMVFPYPKRGLRGELSLE